jgi:hypothetical protein
MFAIPHLQSEDSSVVEKSSRPGENPFKPALTRTRGLRSPPDPEQPEREAIHRLDVSTLPYRPSFIDVADRQLGWHRRRRSRLA